MPTITRIAEQKRRANRRNIYLDGAFAFGCNLNVVAKFRLREGLVLTPDQLYDILQGEVRQECFDDAIKMIERRMHSSGEVRRKLLRKEFGESTIATVIADLTRLGYLNDEQFAKGRAQSAAAHKHHGKRRARQELMKAGVDGDTADKALADVYSAQDSFAVAMDLAKKQAPRLLKLDPAVARRRLVGMLQRRGFDYEAIGPVVKAVLGGEDETD